MHRGPGMPPKLPDAVGVYWIWNACTISHQSDEDFLMKISLNKMMKSLDQTLVLTGVYNCPDIFSKGNTAGHKHGRTQVNRDFWRVLEVTC